MARVECRDKTDNNGLAVLESILLHGLACTSEPLDVAVDPLRLTADPDYPARLTIAHQSRACFTLTSLEAALERQVLAQFVSADGCVFERPANHFDLFGPIAIAIDPIIARRMGALPTLYYYNATAGLEGGPEDILRRLAEIRDVLAVLNHAEELSGEVRIPYLQTEVIEERTTAEVLGLSAKAPNLDANYRELDKNLAQQIFRVFNTDRRSAWQLVDKLDSILGLFQNTDSFVENNPLAFYEQREWRIPFLSQSNLEWFSLGGNPNIRDPQHAEYLKSAEAIRANIELLRGRPLTLQQIRSTWVLAKVDNRPFAEFVNHIVCPKKLEKQVNSLLLQLKRDGRIANTPSVSSY